MEKENRTPGYMAYIPSDVRYDKELKPNEKLLFGEISALATAKGHCWATNKYFADLYDVAVETVSRWISHLAAKGYIKTKIVYLEDGKTIKERRITVNFFRNYEDDEEPIDEKIKGIDEKIKGIDEKIKQPIDEKIKQPIDEKIKENNTSINDTSMNNKENIIKEKSENEEDFVPKSSDPKKKRVNFVKPTVEEIKAYCIERNNGIDFEYFYDHYESNGWKVGKNPMKDWKATVRNWERNGYSGSKKQTQTCGNNKSQEFMDFEPF